MHTQLEPSILQCNTQKTMLKEKNVKATLRKKNFINYDKKPYKTKLNTIAI